MIRIGVIGLGRFGRLHALTLAKLAGCPEIAVFTPSNADGKVADAAALVAHALRGAGSDVTGAEVAEARVDALEVIVAVGFGDVGGGLEAVLLPLILLDAEFSVLLFS